MYFGRSLPCRGTRAEAKHVWRAVRGLDSPGRERQLINIVQDPEFITAYPCVCAAVPVNLRAARDIVHGAFAHLKLITCP